MSTRPRAVGGTIALILALCLAVAGAAQAKTKTGTFISGNLALPIPDDGPGVLVSAINVKPKGNVLDANVSVRVTHPFIFTVNLHLRSPGGRYVELTRNNGADGDNYGSGAADCSGTLTLFDDEATTSIDAGVAPFAGAFQPEQPLTAFDGGPTKGRWDLIVDDTMEANGVGTLDCWQLQLEYKAKKKKAKK
jgi:subtilisin-like proprotein convertase family protein